MPIYEYQCKECGHQLEAIQRFSDAPLTQCPACEKPGLTKQISAPSFRLKGDGWYETDFKTGTKKHGTQSDAQSDTQGGGSSNGAGATGKPGSPAAVQAGQAQDK